MSVLRGLIEAAVTCVKCGAGYGKCDCWTKCTCGWLKERGEPGCSRCSSVRFEKVGPSTYEAKIGSFVLRTYKRPPHWTFQITLPDGKVYQCEWFTATNKAAQEYARSHAWRLGAESPPPGTISAGARGGEGEPTP